MYIDANKETSLPDKNQYNSIKSSKNTKQISWRTVSEFKEKINKLKCGILTSKKEDSKDEKDNERKRRKLNFTNCWEEDLSIHGYARCLRSKCNFISNSIKVIKSHYRECDGVPHFKEQNFCWTCQNYLSSSEAHAEHVPVCKGFNKYNQKDYKYEKGLRTRKSVCKVPFDRMLSWQDQIVTQGSACCGYKMCTFISMSLSDLEEHYNTCCGTAGFKTKCCAHCHFKFSTDDEYIQHRPNCSGSNRFYQTNTEDDYESRNKMVAKVKDSKEKKLKQIVQPKPSLEPGAHEQQRLCTQRHIRSWKLSLSTDKCVKCTFPDCSFIAMSLEDMVRHFSHCNADRNFAKVVCPYCRGRVTSKAVLREHIERSHWNNYGIVLKKNEETSNDITNEEVEMLSTELFENDQTERLRAWQMQIVKFGYAYCMELNCNFMAKTLGELDIHVLTCRETLKKKFTVCQRCMTKLPTEQLEEHKSKCCDEEKSKTSNEKKKHRFETSSFAKGRKALRTYSRKRKVDLDLTNEDSGNWGSNVGYASNTQPEKEAELAERNRMKEKSPIEMEECEVLEENEVQVIEDVVEKVEMERTLFALGDNEVEVIPVDPEASEYDSDRSEIEIIEERKVERTVGCIRRISSKGEIEIPDGKPKIIELVDITEDDQEKSGSGDEMAEDGEVEKVETVEINGDEIEEIENEEVEREKIETVKTVEGEGSKLECEEEMSEEKDMEKIEIVSEKGDEPNTIEMYEHEEEVVTVETIDIEKDEAEEPELEKRKEDTPENVILDDSGDGEKEESNQLWNERKEDGSEKDDKEDDIDSFGLDESEDDQEEYRMEIDEGVMSTIFETLDDDFDKCNPPYSVVGNEIEVFERNENTQSTVIALPNEDSQNFILNEDSRTLDRSEPSTDGEPASDNEQPKDSEAVQDNGQGESSKGVEQSGGPKDGTSSDDINDGDSDKESDNSRDERKKKEDNDGNGDDKKSENRGKVGGGEDNDAEESDEKDNDEDEESDKEKEGSKTKEKNKKREGTENEEGSSNVKSPSEEKCQDKDELEDSTKTEKPKEVRKTRRSGSKEFEKDKVKETKRPARKSKRWSEDDGNEEYIPKGLTWDEDGSENEGESIAKSRGRRGQAKQSSEVKPNTIETQGKKTDEVKCGKCDFKGPRAKFDQHNWTKHFGLGWIEGEKVVDLNDEEEVTRLVRAAFKVTKRGVCEICKEVKRSYMGFVSHVQKCGKSQSEMDALKVKCPHCSTKCLKYCLKTHLHVFHGGKDTDKAKGKNKDEDKDTDVDEDAEEEGDVSKEEDTDRDQSKSHNKTQDKDKDKEKEKGKRDKNEDKEDDDTAGPQEPVVSSSKRKSALKAASKFQEAFKENVEQAEEEKDCEPGYYLYEKGGKLPKLCYKLCNLWYAMKRRKKMIPCRHQSCQTTSSDVKEAKLHHFTCSLLPSETYFCEACDYYSVEESEMQSHVKSNHRRTRRRGKGSKDDVDMDFADNEDVDLDDEDSEEENAEESVDESENDFEECDSVYERQKKKKKKSKKKVGEEGKKRVKKQTNSESEEDMKELVHKQNFCEREKLENLRGDEFYSNALEMTREFEEGDYENESESSEEEEEEEEKEAVAEEDEDSETDHAGVWPQLHTESEDWCLVSREVSSIHLPEVLESISICFVKGDKKDFNWRRFKRFEGDIIDDVPAMFVGGSVRSLSWCKVSFRRALERSVRQYLAVSTAKNIDHLTDVNRSREFAWSLVQIWDCGALENSSPVEPPKFSLGIFQEGGEIWDMAWFPEDTYGKGTNGRLTRIGILATASDDGSVRIWSICEPSQIVINSRFPLFITEPLVKLTIDNFLEDSCVRLSLGRDGIIAGGYVNGSLAVWNLKNITSPFCHKMGKCIIIKPHLVIQAHRTSVTALTFCPNNNRYITSGGLDRIVKLWDLESPWVPVEQYQRELCLDNIWPRNWPMNIYNFEDVYPNNRKGVIRFVKEVISSKHSPCLILDNTCLSLSFSDWLNSLCGCNNTGEVKIRFLKNCLRDQDKKQERNQTTLSSLRLERLNGEDDSDWESTPISNDGLPKALPKTYGVLNAQYGIVIKDHNLKDKGKPLTDTFHPEDFPIRAVNKVSFNPNFKSFTHIAVGYNCGLVRIQRLNELQFNNAIKSFSENAKKPRL